MAYIEGQPVVDRCFRTQRCLRGMEAEGFRGVAEWGPESGVTAKEHWPGPGEDLAVV